MSPIELTLPLPPNIGNARMHWRTKLKAKKQYRETFDLWFSLKIAKRPWDVPPQKVMVSAHVIIGGRSDVDNLFARMKFALDCLVEDKILVDDSPKHLEWAGIPTQEITRSKPYAITFTISPVPEAQP